MDRKRSSGTIGVDANARGASPIQDWGARVAPAALFGVCSLLALIVILTVVRAMRLTGGNDLAAVVDLTKTLVWPAVLLFVVARFERPLIEFVHRLSKAAVKTGETEISFEVEEKKTRVSALLGAATALQSGTNPNDSVAPQPRQHTRSFNPLLS